MTTCTLERAQREPQKPLSVYEDPAQRPKPRPGFLLRTPYVEGFVDDLKRLPAADRQWTGEAWWIAERHEARVLEMVIAMYGGLTIINPGQAADEVVDRHGRSIQERLL